MWMVLRWKVLSVALWCLIAAIFAAFGGFTVRQDITLGLLTACLVSAIRMTGRRQSVFTPYYVRVSPSWYELLSDFKLISTPEEWRSVLQSAKSSADYSVLRDGVLFTVLQQSEDFEHTLIFWDQHQAFGSEFRFDEDMTPIQFETRLPEGGHLPARFFMKPWSPQEVATYSLGIEVRDWWWDKVKGSCPTPLQESRNPLTGSVELTLATLPLSEFDLYWGPADWSDEFLYRTAPKIRKRRDEHRERLGWKDKKHPYEPELDINWPESIEHQYCRVEHRAI